MTRLHYSRSKDHGQACDPRWRERMAESMKRGDYVESAVPALLIYVCRASNTI